MSRARDRGSVRGTVAVLLGFVIIFIAALATCGVLAGALQLDLGR